MFVNKNQYFFICKYMKTIYHPMKFYKKKKINMIYPYEKSYIANNILEILGHGVCLNLYKQDNKIIFLEYFWNPDFIKLKKIKLSSSYGNKNEVKIEDLKFIIEKYNDRYILDNTNNKYIFIDKIDNYLFLTDNYKSNNFIIPISMILKLINDEKILINRYKLNTKWCKCHSIAYTKLIDININKFKNYYGCDSNRFYEFEDMEDYFHLISSFKNKTYAYMTLKRTNFDKYIILFICKFIN